VLQSIETLKLLNTVGITERWLQCTGCECGI